MTESTTHSHSNLEQHVQKLEDKLKLLIHNLAIINGNTVEVIKEILKSMDGQKHIDPGELIKKINQNCDPDPPGCQKRDKDDKS